jgi:hypothetical protein
MEVKNCTENCSKRLTHALSVLESIARSDQYSGMALATWARDAVNWDAANSKECLPNEESDHRII